MDSSTPSPEAGDALPPPPPHPRGTTESDSLTQGPIPVAYRWAWPALGVILLGEVVDLLDSLVTTVAGPSILRDLGHGDPGLIQWLAAGYTLAMAAGLLIGGRLGDLLGRRRVFLVGLAGFTLASLAAALAPAAGWLVTARVVQGLFGAMLLPQGLGMIREMFPPERMGVAFGLFGPVMGLSAVAGPILAGWLVDADFFGWGWRMIFAINLPIGLIAWMAGLVVLPRTPGRRDVGIDLGGALLVAASVSAIVFPLVQGREYGWPLWSFALLAAGIGLLLLFARHQRARAAAGRSTVVEPSLFGNRTFVGGMMVGVAFFSAMMGAGLVLSVLAQLGFHATPLQAGLAAAPQAVGMMAGFGALQALGETRRTMRQGLILAIVGHLLVAAILWLRRDDPSLWWLAPGLFVTGIGTGCAMGPFFGLVLAGIADDEAGSASGAVTAIQQLGGALGVALLGTTFFSVIEHASPGPSSFALAGVVAYVISALMTACAAALTGRLAAVAAPHEGT